MRRRARYAKHSQGPSGALGQRLRRLSEWAVASCVTAAVGCTAEGATGIRQPLSTVTGPVREVACGDLLLVSDPVKPERDLDYIGAYTRGPNNSVMYLLGDYGDPCGSASDQASCLARFQEQINSAASCPSGTVICPAIVVTTHGDEVLRHETARELARVLGKVDTHSEAVLFARLYGLHAACGPFDFLQPDSWGTLVQATSAGYRVQSEWDICGDSVGAQSIDIHEDGSSPGFARNSSERSNCVVGRRPAGLQLSAAGSERESVGAFLSECARLEAASVPAFRRLARELQQLGAARLAAAARQSARDEIRHAAQMRSLARRYGAQTEAPRVAAPQRMRSALEIAHENAVEGCVRETFGALLAWRQAATAQDPVFARVMRGIAADETRHAALSWQVAAHLEPKLTARDRLAVQRARGAALEQLQRDIATDPLPAAARTKLGWPSNGHQHTLLNRMSKELRIS